MINRFIRLPLLCVMTLLPLAAGCAVSQEDEVSIGRDAAPRFEKEFGGLYPDREVQAYVDRVGLRMAENAGRPDLPWSFRVLDSDQINAFALPGGFVYITKGLLFSLEDEAQLAFILGHEAGHVAHRHSVQQLERSQAVQGGATVIGVLAGSSAVSDISQVVAGLTLMKFGRDQEREADMTGLDYVVREGYDPHASVEAMEIIERKSGGKGPPEFLSTHPNPGNREEYLSQRIDSEFAGARARGRKGTDEFERVILDRRRR